MLHHVREFAGRPNGSAGWSWRHTATLLLLAICLPVFAIGALAAGAVAVPVLLLVSLGGAVRAAHAATPPRRVTAPH